MIFTVKNSSDLFYTLATISHFGLFSLALLACRINDRYIQHGTRALATVLLVVFQKLIFPVVPIYSIVFSAEIFFLLTAGLAHLVPAKRNSQYSYTFFVYLAMALLLAALRYTALYDVIYQWRSAHIAYLYIALNLVYFVLTIRQNIRHSLPAAFLINILALLGALFIADSAGMFVFFTFKLIFYLCLLHFMIWRILSYHRKQLQRSAEIEKNFDDTLRRAVNEKIFYMEQSREKMAKMAREDPQTGTLNKKSIQHHVEQLISDKHIEEFSVLLFDIDKFKTINDTLGHIEGDRCIRTLVKTARSNIRGDDEIGRYGGDEFVILLPNADIRTAAVVAERFRKNIEETDNPHFTVSIGITNYPLNGKNFKELITHADEGLYLSKQKGRNKTSYKMID